MLLIVSSLSFFFSSQYPVFLLFQMITRLYILYMEWIVSRTQSKAVVVRQEMLLLEPKRNDKSPNHPRLRVAPPPSRPVAAPRTAAGSVSVVVCLGAAPAIHPARSKFAGPPPPVMALWVAPVIGEARDCFSNSARISGSTVEVPVSKGEGEVTKANSGEGAAATRQHLLFSMSFGIPNVNPRATRANRIIGFLKSERGETKSPTISSATHTKKKQPSGKFPPRQPQPAQGRL